MGVVTTPNTIPIRGVRIAPSVDKSELIDILSGNNGSSRIVELVKLSSESDIESSTSLPIKVEPIIDVRV